MVECTNFDTLDDQGKDLGSSVSDYTKMKRRLDDDGDDENIPKKKMKTDAEDEMDLDEKRAALAVAISQAGKTMVRPVLKREEI